MQFKSQELASSLWALANLRTLLPGSFINAFFYASFPKLAFFNAQVGPNERVMAPLRFPSRTCIPQGGIACIQKGTADAQCDVSLAISCNAFPLPFPLPSVTLLLPLLCLSSSPPQDFSTTLWALGTLRLYPPDTWLEAFQVSGGTPAGCTLWALGTLRLYPPDTWLEAFQVSGGTSAG